MMSESCSWDLSKSPAWLRKEQQCASCKNGWLGSMMCRIPLHIPDKKKLRFKSVFESPATCLDGTARPVDDFMPRVQIKKYFNEGKLRTQLTVKENTDFSSTFVVSHEELVKKYLDHLKHLPVFYSV